MNKNILTNIKLTITADELADSNNNFTNVLTKISNSLVNFDNVYSYIVYSRYEKDTITSTLKEFIITINVSQTECYNTITVDNAITSICEIIVDELEKTSALYVIGYKQPPLEVLLTTYESLIYKLALSQQRYWSSLNLELEDLVQECYVVFIELYNKGYYIHKTLLERSYNNHILVMIRKYRNGQEVLSLNTPVDSNEKLTLADVIPDTSMEEKAINTINDDAKMLQELSDFIIDKIGSRSYNQLLFEYTTHNTTPWGRNKVYWLKDYMKQNGIDDYLKRRY